jgi:hypothetical protein
MSRSGKKPFKRIYCIPNLLLKFSADSCTAPTAEKYSKKMAVKNSNLKLTPFSIDVMKEIPIKKGF